MAVNSVDGGRMVLTGVVGGASGLRDIFGDNYQIFTSTVEGRWSRGFTQVRMHSGSLPSLYAAPLDLTTLWISAVRKNLGIFTCGRNTICLRWDLRFHPPPRP